MIELPKRFNVADYILQKVDDLAIKTAYICGDQRISYHELKHKVNQAGWAFRDSGIEMEDRVLLLMKDTPDLPIAFLGAIKIGAVPVVLNNWLKAEDYRYMFNDSRRKLLVVDKSLVHSYEKIKTGMPFVKKVITVGQVDGYDDFNRWINSKPTELESAPTDRDDSAFWLYSSGSTGKPKGVVHLHRDIPFSVETYAKTILDIKENDILFSAAKLFFAYGLGNGLYFPLTAGATTVLYPEAPASEAMYETINRFDVTLFFAVPTLYGRMLQIKGDLGRVKKCISAGEPLPQPIYEQWLKRFNVEINDGIGSTEMLHIYISNRFGNIKPGSSGKPVEGYEVKIVDESGMDLPEDQIGTLMVKGGSRTARYWNMEDKTSAAMIGKWFNTGDKYYRDKDGYFYYAGRADDMLKVGGMWVSPAEVESRLISHPFVLEVAVIGRKDSQGMVKPMAFVVTKADVDGTDALAKELKGFCKAKIAHYKYPRWIRFVDDLPKTATGKIQRFKLREMIGENI
jgi:benzoate-CoA ligase